jgi:hypothetical protein
VSRDRVRYLGGLAGSLLLGIGTAVGLYLASPPANAVEQGPQRWLIVGGACVVPAAFFYGWFAGMWLAGKAT